MIIRENLCFCCCFFFINIMELNLIANRLKCLIKNDDRIINPADKPLVCKLMSRYLKRRIFANPSLPRGWWGRDHKFSNSLEQLQLLQMLLTSISWSSLNRAMKARSPALTTTFLPHYYEAKTEQVRLTVFEEFHRAVKVDRRFFFISSSSGTYLTIYFLNLYFFREQYEQHFPSNYPKILKRTVFYIQFCDGFH